MIDTAEECKIVPMTEDNLFSVYEIERDSFITPWSLRALRGELNNKLAHYAVMTLNGETVAYAGMWLIFDEAHITNVAVKNSHRGKGYGRGIMSYMMKIAYQNGAERMTLEVREKNLIAQSLYKSLGFECEGRRKRYYTDTGEDALLLWANLGEVNKRV